MVSGNNYGIAQLLQRGGDIEAERQRQNAQILSSLIQSLGQQAGGYLQQKQANDWFTNAQNTPFTASTPDTTVSTDLVNKKMPSPVMIPQQSYGGTGDTTGSPDFMRQSMLNPNPIIQQRAMAYGNFMKSMMPQNEFEGYMRAAGNDPQAAIDAMNKDKKNLYSTQQDEMLKRQAGLEKLKTDLLDTKEQTKAKYRQPTGTIKVDDPTNKNKQLVQQNIWNDQTKTWERQTVGTLDKTQKGNWKQIKDADGAVVGLYDANTDTVKKPEEMGLSTFSAAPLTSSTRTMKETAPKLTNLLNDIETQVNANKDKLGIVAGRWNDFITGKVGTDDPAFRALQTNMNLASSLAMRMHTGSRSSEMLLKEFQGMLNTPQQTPENILAAIRAVKHYAEDVASEGAGSDEIFKTKETKTSGAKVNLDQFMK